MRPTVRAVKWPVHVMELPVHAVEHWLIRVVERLFRAIEEHLPAASCGTAAPESLWSHVTLGLPAITLRTSPPDTTAGGRSPTTSLDPNSVFFRTSVGESQP